MISKLGFDQEGVLSLKKGDDLINLFKLQKTKPFPLCARGQVPRSTHDMQLRPRSQVHARRGDLGREGYEIQTLIVSYK